MDEKAHSKEDFAKYGSISGHFSPPPEILAPVKTKYTSTQWVTLATLAFGNFCVGACVSLQAPFFPAEAESKGASATEYGFIFGIFQLTIFVTAPIMGKLVPYICPKYLLNVGVLIVGVTCVVFGTLDMVNDSRTFVALAFVVRTVEGVGAAAMRTSSYTIVASQFSEGLGRTFAVLETFLGVGLITGPTLGGALYDLGGYGLPFYIVGSLVLVNAVVILFVLPRIERKKLPEKGNLFKFWLHPTTLIYSLSVFTSFNYIGFNAATLEPHLREFHLSGFLLGVMFAVNGTMYAITAPGFGWLSDKKYDPECLSLFGCFVVVVSILLIGPAPFFNLKPNIWFVVAALILVGIALGAKLVSAFTGMLNSTVNRGLPAELSTYGLVSSMIASSQSLGAFAGPSIGGYLLDEYGYQNASMVLLIMETVLIILLITSIAKNKICGTPTSLSFPEEPKAPIKNGHIISEKYIENGCIKSNGS